MAGLMRHHVVHHYSAAVTGGVDLQRRISLRCFRGCRPPLTDKGSNNDHDGRLTSPRMEKAHRPIVQTKIPCTRLL